MSLTVQFSLRQTLCIFIRRFPKALRNHVADPKLKLLRIFVRLPELNRGIPREKGKRGQGKGARHALIFQDGSNPTKVFDPGPFFPFSSAGPFFLPALTAMSVAKAS
jgi:hypothetical protein